MGVDKGLAALPTGFSTSRNHLPGSLIHVLLFEALLFKDITEKEVLYKYVKIVKRDVYNLYLVFVYSGQCIS